jgi:hypothetical protein
MGVLAIRTLMIVFTLNAVWTFSGLRLGLNVIFHTEVQTTAC